MNERLIALVRELDPEVRELVIEVIELERDHLDMLKPHVKEDIRDLVDKYARHSSGKAEGAR